MIREKLIWLLRTRKQSEEPCPFPDNEVVLMLRHGGSRWHTCSVGSLLPTDEWRPINLAFFHGGVLH